MLAHAFIPYSNTKMVFNEVDAFRLKTCLDVMIKKREKTHTQYRNCIAPEGV